jgi:hypothetical protein
MVVAAVVFGATVAMKAQVLASQDLYLHISVGRWILANRLVPDHGIFSATMPTAPWVAHEWLAAVGLAFLYDNLGWGGVLATAAVLLAAAIGALTYETARSIGPIGAICAAVLAWGLCTNHLVARPHVAALPLLAVWLAALVRARRANSVPPIYLVLLMTLWANLHGSFMFGLVFAALFAAEAMFESETWADVRVQAWRWSVFLGVSVLAALVTPHGLSGLWFPFHMMEIRAALDTIYEWQASSLANNAPLILWTFLLLFVSLWLGVRLPICRLVMLMLLLYMAFAHRRHAELLGIAAPLLLLDAIAAMLARSAPSLMSWGALARPAIRLSLIGAALLGVSAAAVAGCRGVVHGSDRYTPTAALAAVEAHRIEGPVFNGYNFGGYLIFRGYAPFIDGRIDMYGGDFVMRYDSPHALIGLLEQYRIAWTILPPADPSTAILDTTPGWVRLHADEWAVVHVRKAAPSR